MSETPRVASHATEQAARAAPASRETSWEAPSFVRELFLGRLDLGLIHPFPERIEEQKRGREFLDRLEAFVRDEVDGELVEQRAKIPTRYRAPAKELGAFGIRFRASTADSDCRSTRTATRWGWWERSAARWSRCSRRTGGSACRSRSSCSGRRTEEAPAAAAREGRNLGLRAHERCRFDHAH